MREVTKSQEVVQQRKVAIIKEREMDGDQAKLYVLTTGKSQKWPTQRIK